jgi:outer membrane protein
MSEGKSVYARVCSLVAILFLIAASWCCGAEEGEKTGEKPMARIGGGAVAHSKPYAEVNAGAYPAPLFLYEGYQFYWRGLVVGCRLLSGEDWSVGPVIQPHFDGFNEDDSPSLDGMDDRDWPVGAGISVSWLTKIGFFGLSGVTDILGKHKGQELEFSYKVLFNLGGFDFIPSAGMRWKSQDLVDYYYGVRPREARAGRSTYEGEPALDPFVRLAVRRKLTERWSFLAAAQYEWLDDEIRGSPLVDADYDASFMVGMFYSW